MAQVNHLEVPAELAFVLSKLETWEVVNAPDKHLAKMSGPLPMMPLAKKLPHDIDYYAFSKGKKVDKWKGLHVFSFLTPSMDHIFKCMNINSLLVMSFQIVSVVKLYFPEKDVNW